eukprot:Mrub_10345.p1 GENE.Mrub_10345~~Mrub_10345.p1  ORF type:complete len:201 (+),score=23.71 Mrub_10345:42-605(+)
MHECFDGYKKDPLFPIPEDAIESNAYVYHDAPNCCNLFTDGSFKDGKCGFGYFVDDIDANPSRQAKICGPVLGKRTNNTAELTAIIKGLTFCKLFTPRPIHLLTDSQYCIMSLTMYKRCHDQYIEAGRTLPKKVQNIGLIRAAFDAINNLDRPVYISKVAAHTGGTDYKSQGNDIADHLSKLGLLYY